MDIYESAKFREKITNLPSEYIVTKDEAKIKIRTKYLECFFIGDKKYTNNIFTSVLEDIDINTISMSNIELKLFLQKNLKIIDVVITWNMSTEEHFYLKNKFLHNLEDFAYKYIDKLHNLNDDRYFFNGKEIAEPIFKKMKLNKKLKKIKKDFNI